MQIYNAVPDKDKNIIIEIDGDIIKIDHRTIDFQPSSELSFAVLRAILPTESQVNAKTFRRTFRELFIRLEADERLGDYEVIAIQTTAKNELLLKNPNSEEIQLVISLDEITELTKPS